MHANSFVMFRINPFSRYIVVRVECIISRFSIFLHDFFLLQYSFTWLVSSSWEKNWASFKLSDITSKILSVQQKKGKIFWKNIESIIWTLFRIWSHLKLTSNFDCLKQPFQCYKDEKNNDGCIATETHFGNNKLFWEDFQLNLLKNITE